MDFLNDVLEEDISVDLLDSTSMDMDDTFFSDYHHPFTKQLIQRFLQTISSKKGRLNYLGCLRRLSDYLKKDFFQINSSDAFAYYNYMRGFRLSDKTIASNLYCINSFVCFCRGCDMVEKTYSNPFSSISIPTIEEAVLTSHIPASKEFDAILSATKLYSQALYVITVLVGRLGCSASSALALKRHDVFLDSSPAFIQINDTYGKPPRAIELPNDVACILNSYLYTMPCLESDSVLFRTTVRSNPLTMRTLERMFRSALLAYGIDTPYTFRNLKDYAILQMCSLATEEEAYQEIQRYAGIGERRMLAFKNCSVIGCPEGVFRTEVLKD